MLAFAVNKRGMQGAGCLSCLDGRIRNWLQLFLGGLVSLLFVQAQMTVRHTGGQGCVFSAFFTLEKYLLRE